MRTPLTVAEGHLELLELEQIDRATAAATVRHELDRLRRVLDDLLAVATGADGDPHPARARLPARSVRGDRHPDHRARPHSARPPRSTAGRGVHRRSGPDRTVDRQPRQQRSTTTPTTTVTIAATVTAETVSITVTDDGTGIDPALLPHVREPFVTTRTAGEGRASGLGLTVVDSLTLAQRSTWAVHRPDRAATATLTYPVE
ncbi:MAG: ATP-binding protein [Acidimicrobiales bacterium]